MCFVKCYLEAIGVMYDNGKVDADKAEAAYELDSEEMVDECVMEIGKILFQLYLPSCNVIE